MIKKKGFTIIEIIVVIAVVGMTLPTIFSLMFLSFQAQNRVRALQNVKESGDYSFSVMQSLIRQFGHGIYKAADSSSINKVCGSTGESYTGRLYFKDINDNFFSFSIDNNRIASTSGAIVYYLTPENVTAQEADFVISCERLTDFDPPLVTIDFTLTVGATQLRYEDKAELRYQTKVKLRNID